MKKPITRILMLATVLCAWAGQAVADCEVSLYENSPPGGHQIVIRQSEFPNGLSQTFYEAPNWWERSEGIIATTVSGEFDYDSSDLFFIASAAIDLQKAVVNVAGEETMGVRVGSIIYGDYYKGVCSGFGLQASRLAAAVDGFGNIVGVDTGLDILTPEGLYNKTLGPSGWGPTDWNDEISSVGFNGACEGATVTLYWDKKFGSPADHPPLALHSDTYSLNLTNHQPWNDEPSSYVVSFPPPPSIVLSGPDFVMTQPGVPYTDPGVTAQDYNGSALSIVTSGSVGTAEGTYLIAYTATDSRGISSTTNRTIIVTRWQEQYNALAQDIGVGADGTVKIASKSGHVFTNGGPSGWTENHNVGSVEQIAVDPDGMAWVVTTDGTIYRQVQSGSGWQQIHNALAHDIGVGADGTVMIISTSGHIFSLTGTDEWTEHFNLWGGQSARIAVDSDGMAWVVRDNGAIFRQTGPSEWQEVYNILAKDIAIGPTGQVWIVSKDGKVYVKNATWDVVMMGWGRAAASITLDQNSLPLAVMDNGAIFRYIP